MLALVLGATLAASWWAMNEDEGESVVLPIERQARGGADASRRDRSGAGVPVAADRLERLAIARPAWPDESSMLARVVRFAPPPPPAPVLSTERQAPPLPFRYVGAIEDPQGRAVFLMEGSQVRMAREGDELGGQYRLARITPNAIEFTYLPLNKTQLLSRQNP